jgi:uncharacterized membrane protein
MIKSHQQDENETKLLARLVHFSLLGGVVISGVVLTLGLVLVFWAGEERAEKQAVHLAAILRSAAQGDAVAILQVGLLLLMLTPVARVAVLAWGWWYEGDRWLAWIALSVLGLLAASLWLGSG